MTKGENRAKKRRRLRRILNQSGDFFKHIGNSISRRRFGDGISKGKIKDNTD